MNRTAATTPTPFEKALAKQITDIIKREKADGTVSMSLDNLKQMLRPIQGNLEGMPRGTNARYYFNQMVDDLTKGNRFIRASQENKMDRTAVARELVTLAKTLTGGTYYRLDDKGIEKLYVISQTYDLRNMYKAMKDGDSDFPMEPIDKLIDALERLKKMATKHNS